MQYVELTSDVSLLTCDETGGETSIGWGRLIGGVRSNGWGSPSVGKGPLAVNTSVETGPSAGRISDTFCYIMNVIF